MSKYAERAWDTDGAGPFEISLKLTKMSNLIDEHVAEQPAVKDGRTQKIQIMDGYLHILIMIHIAAEKTMAVAWNIAGEDDVPQGGFAKNLTQGLACYE